MAKEGEEAPDFTLQADDERKVSLKDYRGKKVVLYFYPKDGTPGCTREAIEFRDITKEFEKEGAIILGVSKDSINSHQKFKQKHELLLEGGCPPKPSLRERKTEGEVLWRNGGGAGEDHPPFHCVFQFPYVPGPGVIWIINNVYNSLSQTN